ncbi:recombinase family protein [Mameliella sp. MMSF_3455]|uniref:recombinase family protein n=1 Tax=Mameliella sp. MMSF_3455 TaxID=3046714 RepID=UPI00273D2C3B|nr:recombinase family protein [Mameliella sp. MMSF_3455]
MLRQLKRGKAAGLIMHKIDRSARYLRDWADLGDAIDLGIDVRFVHDPIDLHTRGGRLTADIQAVIAADFIRNLREEVRKGIQGRLRQGFYPFKAPRGYLDAGPRQVKRPDPAIAPLIVFAFQRYACGTVSLAQLGKTLHERGLETKAGTPLTPGILSAILHNPFYKGTVVVKGQHFDGHHQPLVTEALFDKVQKVFESKKQRRRTKHHFRYRQTLRCTTCGRHLVGEQQKGRVYYRCQRRHVCVREDRISAQDDRYELFSGVLAPENGQLEPWGKFDSPRGIDQPQDSTCDKWLS